MKNSYRILHLIILISAISSLNAQNVAIGVTGDIGFNKITNIEDAIIGLDLDPSTGSTNSSVSILAYEEKNFVLSRNLGFFIEKNIGKKSSIVLQCAWMQVKGAGTFSPLTSTTNGLNGGLGNYGVIGQPYGVIGDSTIINNNTEYSSSKTITLNYIAVPIMYRYKVKKLGLTGGILPMFGLSGRGIYSQKNGGTNETEAAYQISDFAKVNVGTTVGFDYEIAKNLRIKAAYYQGLRAISKAAYYKNKSKIRQINVGIAYIFWNSEH